MEGETGLNGSIINAYHSSYMQGDQMERESRVTRGMIDELHSSAIQ